MQKSLRLRSLFLLCGLVAAGLAAVVLYGVGRVALEAALGKGTGPDPGQAAAEALGGAFFAGLVAVLFLVVPISLWIGGIARRPLAELRAALAAREPLPWPGGPLVEANALAAILARLREDHQREIGPLLEEREELAYLIDSVGEGILQVDADGRIVRANRTARDMLGLPDRIENRPLSTLVRHGELHDLLDTALRGVPVEPVELAFNDRRILVVAHRLAGRASPGAVAILVDLTQLRRLEVVRRDFVANASHELKTPLTSIRGYAETLLADHSLPDELRQAFLRTIYDNAARLQRIVDDLLDLSRLESGGWRPDLRSVDVAGIATEVWDGLRHIGESKSIAFSIDAVGRPAALADPVAVRQILANLIDNAIRYTPDGGRITVRVAESAGPVRRAAIAPGPPRLPREPQGRPADDARWIVVEVADTGVGIPRDALPRVFERFYRVDPSRSRDGGGTGLGLAIVKHLVGSMGGDVVAESELGKGSTFRFWLPAAVPAPDEPAAAADTHTPAPA